jgi:hypothetical protein
MANLNHLCRTLLHAMDTGKRDLEDHVVLQIRAALSEPEPEEPTRDEAVAVYTEVMAAHDCQTLGDMAEHFARAVLARWGTPPRRSNLDG